jgi:hypothetical protein
MVVVAGLVLAGPAAAQTAAPNTTGWTPGTTLNLFGGIGVDSSHTGGAAGGAFGWDVTPRFSVEGSGTWFDRGSSAEGFAADLSVLINLRAPRRAVPFVKVGGGLYWTSFDPSRSPMPEFYRERLEPSDVFGQHVTFTDPAIVAGGGVTLWLTENVSIRPEVDVKLVTRSDIHPVGTAVIRFAYHFEDHPVESRR